MSEHYEVKQLAHNVGPFEIKVGYFYEDIHPEDLFDNSPNPDNNGKPYYDTDEMAKRIDGGLDAWFGFWAKVYYKGHEMGYAFLLCLQLSCQKPYSGPQAAAKKG